MTHAFANMSLHLKAIHAAALCAIGLTVILLMAPASLHRIAFHGEDDADFVRTGSLLLIAAPLPLAAGITLDTYVAVATALQSETTATILAIGAAVMLLALWYVYPAWRRSLHARSI
jgi:hypothetical protein